ncbi:leucine-rich melanocyte differentiation-associated protein-like isoform X2 [Oratosquilla oratoria]|uniref:leucine-rich melanocyte differentiation-associated protein-like isoform X2 n=1 Tax=Oratosquilla oratoria TaxID=337810 RepID=UPI003F774B11
MLGPAADYLTQSYFAYFRVPFPGPHRVTAGTQNPFSAFCRSPLVTRDAALSHKDSVVRLLCFRKEQDLSWVVPDEGDNELKQRTMSAHLCITTYRAPDNEVLKLELCFVGQDCQRIPGILGATYGLQTKRLDLSFNAIKSVKGLDKFPYLEELILDNNCVDDSVTIPRLDTLHTLSLNKNKLSNLPKLVEQVKRQLPNLRYLSLLGNAACPDMLSPLHTREEDYAAYRLYVLQHLPRLRFLDSTAVRRSEVRQARREAKRLKQLQLQQQQQQEEQVLPDKEQDLPEKSQLQQQLLEEEVEAKCQVEGSYGVCRYHYNGLHSEGNRFIRNHEL